jgi:molybdopterin/thiamine biosynthesis adenylyltransferase
MTKPIILSEGKYSAEDLQRLLKQSEIWRKLDLYKIQLEELFEISYPSGGSDKSAVDHKKQFINDHLGKHSDLQGDWIYFPWSGLLLHTLPQKYLFKLRTNRNQLLITAEEQEKLYNSCIGLVGLSNGNSAAAGLQYQGIAKTLKLADFDNLATTNLNRVKANLSDVSLPKIEITSKQIYEINPECKIISFPEGLNENNLDNFVNSDPKPQLIVEIIDDFEMKIRLRLKAREAGISVVMFSNLGDSVLVDMERFDLNPKLELFNGKIGNMAEKILEQGVHSEEINKYAVEIVGKENVPQRALETLSEINKTLVGRPQLSSTVNISGALCSYIARKIILGDKNLSGRIIISLDELFKI